jgi:hypothetical protein
MTPPFWMTDLPMHHAKLMETSAKGDVQENGEDGESNRTRCSREERPLTGSLFTGGAVKFTPEPAAETK